MSDAQPPPFGSGGPPQPPTGPPPGYGPPSYGAPGSGAPGYGAPGYGAPGYGPPGYGGAPPPFPKPDNGLGLAIASTLLCCVPIGIAAIVFASQVDSKWAAGDFNGAQESAKKAKTFTYVGAGIGFVVIIAYVILVLAVGGSTTTTYR